MTTDCIAHPGTTRAERAVPRRPFGRVRDSRPVATLIRLAAAWRRRQLIAGTVRTLSRLDRRTLEDIGVPPERIRELAEGLDRTTHDR
jgi:uncharacterized protein YjiS (DUF1127 family)